MANVLLDGRKARRIALAVGLSVTGTPGIIVQAKLSGHLPSARDGHSNPSTARYLSG